MGSGFENPRERCERCRETNKACVPQEKKGTVTCQPCHTSKQRCSWNPAPRQPRQPRVKRVKTKIEEDPDSERSPSCEVTPDPSPIGSSRLEKLEGHLADMRREYRELRQLVTRESSALRSLLEDMFEGVRRIQQHQMQMMEDAYGTEPPSDDEIVRHPRRLRERQQ